MTPRQKYDLATAGWCVVAAVVVYLVIWFVLGAKPDFMRSATGRAVMLILAANIVIWVPLIRLDGRSYH